MGTSFGEAKVINLASGGILYDLKTQSKAEISNLKFNISDSEFWLFGACWGGKVLMWTKPSPDNNFVVNVKPTERHLSHQVDVISLDSNKDYVASGDA